MTDDSRSVPPPQEAGFHKANWPFYWITQTSNRYMQVMERRLKTIGMDVAYWRVLMSLRGSGAVDLRDLQLLHYQAQHGDQDHPADDGAGVGDNRTAAQ